MLKKHRAMQLQRDRKILSTLNFISPPFGQPPAGLGRNEGCFCRLRLLPPVSSARSASALHSRWCRQQITPRRLGLKTLSIMLTAAQLKSLEVKKISCTTQINSSFQLSCARFFLCSCTTSFSLSLTGQVWKKRVIFSRPKEEKKKCSFHDQTAP